jgi:uncharacterized protein
VHPITCDQLLAAAFPHAALKVRICETHLSFVVLTGNIAYKVKKALKLDFIDASSLQRRRELSEEELRINRRFAAEIYLEVVPIVVIEGRLVFEAVGAPVEYAVKMRQFDEHEEMQALLRMNALTATDLARFGERIASIHATSDVLRKPNGRGTHAFVRKVQENLASISARAAILEAESQVSDLTRWSETTLQYRIDELLAREQNGFIRECHGDLHTGNIVRWNAELTAFDAIEFDVELRFTDVLNDAAFLWMDLLAKNHSDVAFSFLNRYLECTGDYAGLSLLCFYSVYRALVRAKVELISFEQRPNESTHADDARAFLCCAEALSKKRQSLLIVMHGASGSGKSWLSGQLVPALPAVRIRSDLERKRLAGIEPADLFVKAPQEIYSLEFNERTYAHLLECARRCLRGGLNVIVDAAFLKTHERLAFASMAREEDARFSILSCEADPQTLRSRIMQRNLARNDPSDADEHVMLHQLQTMDTFAPEEAPHILRVDTGATDAVSNALRHARSQPTRS